MDISEVRKLMQQVITIKANMPYNYGLHERDIIDTCDKLEALGRKWGEAVCPNDFRIVKEYYICNSSTGYQPKDDTWYVIWDNGNIGRLQFVSDTHYYDVQDEWEEFKNRLLSYNPLDYDKMNDFNVYDIENGKRLMADYQQICDETLAKMKDKIKQVQLREAKEKYERLLNEVKEWAK